MTQETMVMSFLVRIIKDYKAPEMAPRILVQHIQTGEEVKLRSFQELVDFLRGYI